MKARHIVIAALFAATFAAADAASLKERFRARRPRLNQLKAAGKVGETSEGYVEARLALTDPKDIKLLAEERADRRILYQAIARAEGVTVQQVARRAGKRNWARARPGEWYKKSGKWIQKK